MSDKDAKIVRRKSQSSMSPFLTEPYVNVDDETAKKATGQMSIGECEMLLRKLEDLSVMPKACKDYFEEQRKAAKKYEGGGAGMAGRTAHAQLQRRWTSHRDPLAKK